MIPSQPTNLVPRPFASEGNFTVIPDRTGVSGRASFTDGFPTETQRPLRDGGVAPNRTDFNGILNLLSAFVFWQQSGGQFSYKTTLNYTTPNIVYHAGKMWWCLKDNGPDSANQTVEPGSNEEYWQEYFHALYSMGGEALKLGNPVGSYLWHCGIKGSGGDIQAPDGYFRCWGEAFDTVANPELYAILGTARLPDARGLFLRAHDPAGKRDPDYKTRAIGSVQDFAMQPISGSIQASRFNRGDFIANGAFYGFGSGFGGVDGHQGNSIGFAFDSSRQTKTAPETRPANLSALLCIKHD